MSDFKTYTAQRDPHVAFTVLIGSAGRDSLRFTLDSIARQRRVPGDQCIVVFDSYEHGEQKHLQDLVHSYGEGFIADSYTGINAEGKPYHWLGVEQINHAMRTIPILGTHIFTVGDDDVFVDGAYEALRPFCAQDVLRPVIYKFLAPNRWLLWDRPRMAPCLISGCCIAAPRPFVDPMHTRLETTHDYDWIVEIINQAEKFHREPLWLDYVGVIARPDRRGSDVTHKGVSQCWKCHNWHYREDISLTMTRCEQCGVVWDVGAHRPKVVEACDPSLGNLYTQEAAHV